MLWCPKYHPVVQVRYCNMLIRSVHVSARSFHTKFPRHKVDSNEIKSTENVWPRLIRQERRRAWKFVNCTIQKAQKALVQQATQTSDINDDTAISKSDDFDKTNDLTTKRLTIGSLLQTESFSILNQQDRHHLVTKYRRLHGSSAKVPLTGRGTRYDCAKLLYLFMNSKDFDIHDIQIMSRVVEILINHLWFHNAAALILKMDLQLGDLLSFIDALLKNNELLHNSSWMKFLFLCRLSDVLEVVNPRLVSQISYLNYKNGYNLIKLKFMNLILHRLSTLDFSVGDLDMAIKDFHNNVLNGKTDADISALHLYAMIDIVKAKNQGNLEGQLSGFNKLLTSYCTRESIFEETNFFSSILNHLIEVKNYELIKLGLNKDFDLYSFVLNRQQKVLELLSRYSLQCATPIDFFSLTRFVSSRRLSIQIYKEYSASSAYNDKGSSFTPLIIDNLGNRILNQTQFFVQEFGRLSRSKKGKGLIIEYKAFELFDNVNEEVAGKHYGRFLYLLGEISDKDEVKYVVQFIVKYFYVDHREYLKRPRKLLKMLLISSNVDTLSHNRQKQIGNSLMSNAHDFFEKDATPVRTLKSWIDILSESKKISASYFLPFLLIWLRNCHQLNDRFKSYVLADRLSDLLNKFIISTINYSSTKNVSKIYLSNRELLKAVAIEFSKCDYKFKKYILRKQIESIAKMNADDNLNCFSRRITAESVILELFIKMLFKILPRIKIENSDLNLDPKLFWDIHDFLDSITLKYSPEYPQINAINPIKATSTVANRTVGNPKLNFLLDSLFDSKVSPLEGKPSKEFDCSENNDIYGTMMNMFWNLNIDSHHSETGESNNGADRLISESKNDKSAPFLIDIDDDDPQSGNKTRLSLEQKQSLLNIFCTLRIKSKMVEDLISRYPDRVPKLIAYYYQTYNGDIPLTLIHSMMIGIFKSKNTFNTKLELFKRLEKLGAMIYDSNDSSLFHCYVRFKDVHIALVDLIIKDAKVSGKGSLVTLSWGLRKFIRTPNISQYGSSMKRWVLTLQEMKVGHTEFWSNV